MWNKLDELYPKLGYSSLNNVGRSLLIEKFVEDGLKEHENMLTTPSNRTQKEIEIGIIADRRKGGAFALTYGVKDLIETRKNLKKALDEGLISKEQYDKENAENTADHQHVAQIELSKQYPVENNENCEEIEEPKPKLGRTIEEWHKMKEQDVENMSVEELLEKRVRELHGESRKKVKK
jgi:hypothetical protein